MTTPYVTSPSARYLRRTRRILSHFPREFARSSLGIHLAPMIPLPLHLSLALPHSEYRVLKQNDSRSSDFPSIIRLFRRDRRFESPRDRQRVPSRVLGVTMSERYRFPEGFLNSATVMNSSGWEARSALSVTRFRWGPLANHATSVRYRLIARSRDPTRPRTYANRICARCRCA